MRIDIAIEGADPEHARKFRFVGLPIGIATALFFSIGMFFGPNQEIRGIFGTMLLMAVLFCFTEGLDSDFGNRPKPAPVLGGFMFGYIITILALVVVFLIRSVN